jgi:hypothetical protein
VFTSERYAKLYKQLIERGSTSRVEALRVGALIEELDLTDLRQAIEQSEDEAIRRVLGNLQRATRNHLRAFAGALKAHDARYEAKYLSQTEFDAIAASSHERGGMGGAKGRKQGQDSCSGDCQGACEGACPGQGPGHGAGNGTGGQRRGGRAG